MSVDRAKACPKATRVVRLANGERRGFSLSELAIVLGIFVLVLGGIFQVARSTYMAHEAQQTLREIVTVTQNIHDLETGALTWSAAYQPIPFDITSTLYAENLLPADIVKAGGTSFLNSYGGKFIIYTCGFNGTGGACAGSANAFRIELQGVSILGCDALLVELPMNDSTLGLMQVLVNNNIVRVVKGTQAGGVPAWNAPLPLTTAQASAACNGGNTSTVQIDLDYKLHP